MCPKQVHEGSSDLLYVPKCGYDRLGEPTAKSFPALGSPLVRLMCVCRLFRTYHFAPASSVSSLSRHVLLFNFHFVTTLPAPRILSSFALSYLSVFFRHSFMPLVSEGILDEVPEMPP